MMNNQPAIQGPSERRIAMRVKPAAERAIKQRHPWLFDQSIVRQSHEGRSGDLAVIFDQRNRFLAIGLYDPDSPIRVRLLQYGEQATIDQAWFRERLVSAGLRRAPLQNTKTTGYRLVHGENDELPGLVVDLYGKTVVIKLDTAAWIPHLWPITQALAEVEPDLRMILRLSRKARYEAETSHGLQDGQLLVGSPIDGPVVFYENGIIFEADVIRGQKTGFFLDQRDNRALVEATVATNKRLKRLVNVFAYSGAFGLYAARGGIESVTSIDASPAALEMANNNFKLNRNNPTIAATEHSILVGDAFKMLSELGAQGQRYDLVVVDPPSFAKQKSEFGRALNAYFRLATLALAILQKDGILVMSSCSSRVSADAFYEIIHTAADRRNRPLREITRTGHAIDHPVGFPQGAYLKCLFAFAG
jgi:23S rRNA (cytosine1962-C5)-methyltransferase